MTFKTLRRRGASLFLALTMCVSLLQVPAYAVEDVEGTVSDAPDLNVTIIPVSDITATQSNSVNTGDVDTYVPTEVPSTPDAEVGETPSTPDAGKEELPSISDAGEEETPSTPSEGDGDASQTPDDSFDLKDTQRPGQSETVGVAPGNSSDATDFDYPQPSETPGTSENPVPPADTENPDKTEEPGENENPGHTEDPDSTEVVEPQDKNWDVFYDKDAGIYKLTFNINKDAEGDQTIDLTWALTLLNQYADAGRLELEQAQKDIKEKKAEIEQTLETSEEYQQYKSDCAEYQDQINSAIHYLINFGDGSYNPKDKTDEEIVADFNAELGWLGPIGPKPSMPENIKSKLEELENLQVSIDLVNKSQADVMQPGDIRKFEIYLTSDSQHTYKYKEGSFTLATANMETYSAALKELWENDPESYKSMFLLPNGNWVIDPETLGSSNIDSFDGQLLPNGWTNDEKTLYLSLGFTPIRNLLADSGVATDEFRFHSELKDLLEYVVKHPNRGGQEAVDKVLAEMGCTMDNLSEGVMNYVLSYYSTDDVTYSSLNDLFANCTQARADATATSSSSSNKKCTFGGETLFGTLEENFVYNNFYQSLLAFVFGDSNMVDSITGEGNPESGRWEYDNTDWTSIDKQLALEYYMAHKEIWKDTDSYFQQLLEQGLSANDATWKSFMMALNINGHMTGNSWQLSAWPWYNSIQLEQSDGDLTLTKVEMVDKVDEDGNVVTDEEGNTVQEAQTITDSETKFQLWRIDKDVEIDGVKQNVKMYCTYDAETNTYTFSNVESFLETKDGNLEVLYTLMQDTVYYLQEYEAPKCNDVDADGTTYVYEKDPTVYVIMDPDKCDITMDEAIEANNQFSQNAEDEQYGYLGALTNEGLTVQFVNKKVAVPPTTPPTPEEPTPEEPTPEEPDDPTPPPTTPDRPDRPTTPPTTDIPDPDVPLAPGPDPEEPPVIIEEPDVPLAELPPEVEIPEPEVPLAGQPPVTTTIPEPEVPLADVPMTGDASGLWYALMGLAACGLVVLNLRKKEEA